MNKFKKARQVMGDTLQEDDDLYQGYQANVAMLLHDRYGITDYEKRNEAADEILSLIFSIPPTLKEKDETHHE